MNQRERMLMELQQLIIYAERNDIPQLLDDLEIQDCYKNALQKEYSYGRCAQAVTWAWRYIRTYAP